MKIPQSPQDCDNSSSQDHGNNSSLHLPADQEPTSKIVTIRDVLSMRQMPTHWQTGELPSSLGPKSNHRSLSCTEEVSWNCEIQIQTYLLVILSQALLVFLSQMESIGTHLIYFKILMPISITYKPYFSFISPLRFKDMGISIFLDWSLYLLFTPVLL